MHAMNAHLYANIHTSQTQDTTAAEELAVKKEEEEVEMVRREEEENIARETEERGRRHEEDQRGKLKKRVQKDEHISTEAAAAAAAAAATDRALTGEGVPADLSAEVEENMSIEQVMVLKSYSKHAQKDRPTQTHIYKRCNSCVVVSHEHTRTHMPTSYIVVLDV